MNKKLTTGFMLATAVLGMGLSMPNCPGQQAMQQQIDTLQTGNADLKRNLQTLDAKVKTLTDEVAAAKKFREDVTPILQAYKGLLEQMDASVKGLQAKVDAMSAPPKGAKGGKKKGH